MSAEPVVFVSRVEGKESDIIVLTEEGTFRTMDGRWFSWYSYEPGWGLEDQILMLTGDNRYWLRVA